MACQSWSLQLLIKGRCRCRFARQKGTRQRPTHGMSTCTNASLEQASAIAASSSVSNSTHEQARGEFEEHSECCQYAARSTP